MSTFLGKSRRFKILSFQTQGLFTLQCLMLLKKVAENIIFPLMNLKCKTRYMYVFFENICLRYILNHSLFMQANPSLVLDNLFLTLIKSSYELVGGAFVIFSNFYLFFINIWTICYC